MRPPSLVAGVTGIMEDPSRSMRSEDEHRNLEQDALDPEEIRFSACIRRKIELTSVLPCPT